MEEIGHENTITVNANGQACVVRAGSTVADLLGELNITPTYVVVQLDGEIVPRTGFGQATLKEGSKVEIITLAGGGESRTRSTPCKPKSTNTKILLERL